MGDWPKGRYHHAAACLGYGGEYMHLLFLGGIDRDGKCLKDMWLFSLGTKSWNKVYILCNLGSIKFFFFFFLTKINSFQDQSTYYYIPPRWGHSAVTNAVIPGVYEDVIIYGGSDKDCKGLVGSEEDDSHGINVRNLHKTSDTTIISFSM